MNALFEIFDITLLATGALIIFITMMGAYLHSIRRDPCLKAFEHYHVTLERTDGKLIWGELELESTGFELRYRDSVQDANHIESSYILYGNEFSDIQAVYRYVDDLSPEDLARRYRDLERYFHPGPMVRLVRSLQHFFTLAGDSLAEVMGLVMGRLRKPAGRYIGEVTDDQFKRLSTAVVGSVGALYDPLLERFVGSKVVVDLLEGDIAHEHVVVFKNYSPDFYELLNVQYPEPRSLSLNGGADQYLEKCVTVVREEKLMRVTNNSTQPMLIMSLRLGQGEDSEEEMLNVVMDAGETVELHPEELTDDASLVIRVVRDLDMIVPRTRCIVRHRADRYEPSLVPEIIFDLGVMLRGDSRLDAKEERLRERLKALPDSAQLASNLGAVLMQKQQFAEAEKLLEQAYANRLTLPDQGRRTLMMLNELRRRHSKTPQRSPEKRAEALSMPSTTQVHVNGDGGGTRIEVGASAPQKHQGNAD